MITTLKQPVASLLLASVALSALLAGCGGSSDTPTTPPTTVTPPAVVPPAPVPPVVAPPVPVTPPAPVPPPVNTTTVNTGTTAYGVLGTGNARIAFIPSTAGVVAVVLEKTPTVATSGGPQLLASAIAAVPVPIPFSFKVDACSVDSNDLKGICIGYASSKIGVMDLTKFATTLASADITVQEIDSGAGTVANSYSGGSCINCGVAIDIGKKRFVVGGSGGFRVFDYGSTKADATYAIPVGENFAFLPRPTANSFIIAPEYTANNGKRMLRVVNLDNGKVYAWTKHTDSLIDLGNDAVSFQAGDVDAAAVDINTGLIAMTSEFSADFLLLDFAQAKFDETALTFDAPFQLALPTDRGLARLTDVAISSTGSILLSHGEFDANIGITQLPAAAGSANVFASGTGALATLTLNNAALDRSACGNAIFAGKGDPHGLGLYAGLDKGQRGLIINNDNSCAAIVDLAALLALPRAAGKPNEIDMTLPAVKALVKFVKLQ